MFTTVRRRRRKGGPARMHSRTTRWQNLRLRRNPARTARRGIPTQIGTPPIGVVHLHFEAGLVSSAHGNC